VGTAITSVFFKGVSPPLSPILRTANGRTANIWLAGKSISCRLLQIRSGGTTTNDDVVSLWIDPATSSFGAAETKPPFAGRRRMLTNWSANAAITESPSRQRSSRIEANDGFAHWHDVGFGDRSILSEAQHRQHAADATVTWPTKDSGYVLQEIASLIAGQLGDKFLSAPLRGR